MKKITTFLALLLTCIIGATAADFVPKVGTKYLIKCKGDNNVVYTPENSNILKYQQSVSDASYFTIESKVVENVTYFYIHPAGDAAKYVYTAKTPSNDNNANDGVVGVTNTKDDATCLWKITFNYGDNGQPCAFNITPKGYDNYSWNCRNKGIGYWHNNGGGNNHANNSWYITPNVELNGYYTIKNTAYKDAKDTRYTNLYNNFSEDNYTRAAQELPTPLTNNYVWHVTTANNNVLTVLNGQGTPLYHDGDASLPKLNVAYSDGTNYYFGEALNGGNSGRNYKLTIWKGGDYNKYDNQWEFAKVDASNIYNVVCNIEDGYVTYNATSEKAKNGGFFFISSTPEVANFTAATVPNYDAAVSISGNTINVNYAYNLAKITELAKEALAKTGVGYPTATAATRTALENAVKAGTNAAAIGNALNAFKTSTDEIQMPEDGKAYRIKVPYNNGTVNLLYCNGEKIGNKAASETTPATDEVFVCHIVNGKYMFATNYGTYLSWADSGDNGANSYSTSAQTTTYIVQNDWTIEPATLDKGQAGSVSLTDRADVFGLVQMKALEKTGTTNYYLNSRINDAFISQYPTDKFYDTGWNGQNRSCYYQFEEVEYPNTITFHDAQNINGVSHIATFSAPFATIIPEGVKAYYVSAKGTEATMTAIEAQAIPANQGVILTSESGDAATMVPAADETAATITGNQLGHSAGAAQTLTAGEGYILGNGTEGTAFYPCKAGSLPINKAYLLGNGESAIVMNFGNAVTGINTIAAPASAKAPIFDLSGRRVVKATKGLYIQNGKKFIVK
ncbi:hypothetical protein [Prevotellamassilia timonensis]|uniref:hypothetical protein n=1 Tax=Prevotellamassilia timonensis TaxID=1852370 RepID=UPI00307C27D5